MMKHINILLLIVCAAGLVQAQSITSFSEDTPSFLKELDAFMNFNKQPLLEETHERFESMTKSGVFSEEDLQGMRAVSQSMIENRLLANPHFNAYLQSCMMVKNLSESNVSLTQWNAFLMEVFASGIKLKRDNYKTLLSFGETYFGEQIIYRKTSKFYWASSQTSDLGFKVDPESGISVEFKDIDLVCLRNSDSLQIFNTSGSYFILEKKFVGSGGTVNWDRFEVEDDISVELSDFEVELTRGLYTCNEVNLSYPKFFGTQLIRGTFEDKIGSKPKNGKGLYPKFESVDQVLEIDNFGAGITYSGGFKLAGLTIYGPAVGEQQSEIRIENDEGELKLQTLSDQFKIIVDKRITAEQVSCNIFMNGDSIYHPNIIFRYDIPEQKLELKRGNNGNQKTPFYSSIHRLNIQADDMNYYLGGDSLVIGEKTLQFNNSNAVVQLESQDYFSEAEFISFRGGADYNMINMIYKTAQEEGLRKISAYTVAEQINPKFTAETIETVLYALVEGGFINYYPDTKVIEVKDKIYLYAEATRGGTDFDRLKLESVTEKLDNGVLDLKTGDLTMFGIKNLEFAPKKFVGLKPYQQQLTIQANRDMKFGGRLFAGYSLFTGDDMRFNYDEFNIELDSTKYLDLFLPIIDAVGEKGKLKPAYALNSTIEHFNGVLLIDAPKNKSGKDDIPLFPALQSKGPSYIYYDYKDIFDGVYTRDSFYVELEPFTLNSLLSLDRDVVKFDAQLVSSEIFPPFKEEISIQPDTSLGFVSVTPIEGYPIYQGAGNYRGQMSLSNQGFLGEGELTYLKATIQSEDLVFMPKQLTASADEFLLEQGITNGIEVPRATGNNVTIDWRPYQDSMYVRSTDEEDPFEIYTYNAHKLYGTIILTPDGMRGNGKFYWPQGTFESDLFSFKQTSIASDTSIVVINSIDTDIAALETSNMRIDVDFEDSYGKFYSNIKDNYTKLPRNKFSTNLMQFEWDIDDKEIIFKPESNEVGKFLSIHEKQDSLMFDGDEATLNLETTVFSVTGVPFVKSADAFIYTSDSIINIRPGADIDTLFDAKIIADTLSKFHVINNAKVKIKGKNSYSASGFYEYNVGPHKQEIEFQDITGLRGLGKGSYEQRGVVTRAKGTIEQGSEFYIDDKIEYSGEINLQSNQKELFFKGFARLDANLQAKHWFFVNFEGDRSDLSIQFDRPQNYEGEIVRNGIFVSRENAEIYPRIMAPLYFRKDRMLIEATGLLNYDERLDHFRFGDSLKVMKPSTNRGNLIVFENKTGKVKAEGKFNFCEDLEFMAVDAAGRLETTIQLELDTASTGPKAMAPIQGEFMLGVDIVIPEELERVMMNDFLNYALDAPGVVYANDVRFYQKAVSELFPDNEEINQAIGDISLNTFLIPEKYNQYSFLFNKLNMKWEQAYQSFITLDEKVGISSLNGKPFNKKVTCFMETKMPMQEKDDRLYLYLRSPSGSYYFFGYKGGILNVFSNNSDFAEVFLDYKEKDLLFEVEKDKILELQWGNEGTVQAFINRVRASVNNTN